MDTRFLESFVAVIDSGSIAEAARRANLTPAAVAQRIRALESEIGAHLILRSGRTVRLTEAGAAILGRVRNFLREGRDLKSIAANDRPSGELRVGAFQTATYGHLPSILTLLTKKYPQIEVHIIRANSPELYQMLLDGDLDVAILNQPPFAISKACDWRVLREEPLIVLTPASVPARHPHAMLASEPFIRLDRNSWTGRFVDRYLRRAGIRPRERFELDGLEQIAVMVDQGFGVSLVPDWAPPWPEGLSLAKIPLPNRTIARRIAVMWTRNSVRLRLVHAFLESAAAALAPGHPHVRRTVEDGRRHRGGAVTKRRSKAK